MKTKHFILCFSAVVLLSTLPHAANADTFGSGANSFEIELVIIDDPSNPADTTGDPNPVGSVDYVYRMGKYEISRDMIEMANAEGGLGITLFDMTNLGGISPNRPATGVSWNEAARFTNWLNTSHGFPAAYTFSAQPGEPGYDGNANIELWVDGEPGFDAANPFRNSQTQYFLPNVNEWYKAAYYDQAENGGAGGYWEFPNGSDTAPMAVGRGSDPDTAVYSQLFEQGPADIRQAGGLSPYGVMGLGGNVWEWEETELDLMNDDSSSLRGVRGGSWGGSSVSLSASDRSLGCVPAGEFFSGIGFRVASIASNPMLIGDLNGDFVLDAIDIDLLDAAVRGGFHPKPFDLNDDDLVDSADHGIWVHELKNTWLGDANLNREFNSGDMVQVFNVGKYETDEQAGWAEGDWNGDGVFSSSDMVTAFADGGYEQGLRTDAAAVPEPTSVLLLLSSLIVIATRRRHFDP